MKHISWFLSVPQYISDSIQTLLLLAHLAFYCLFSSIKHKIHVTSTIIRFEKLGRGARITILALVSRLSFQYAGSENTTLFQIGQSPTRKSLCYFYHHLRNPWDDNLLIKWPIIRAFPYPNIGTTRITILYLQMYLYTCWFYSSLGPTFLWQYRCIKHDSYHNPKLKRRSYAEHFQCK